MTLQDLLNAVGVLAVLLTPVVVVVALLMIAEARQRARLRVIERQIMLTDAVHAELGAVVAPFVEKRAFRPWRVIFPMSPSARPEVGRLVGIANRVMGAELRAPAGLHIVFTHAA